MALVKGNPELCMDDAINVGVGVDNVREACLNKNQEDDKFLQYNHTDIRRDRV